MPSLDFRLAWTFIPMLPSDDEASAAHAAARVRDPRLTAFHDTQHRLGRAMARRLGWQHHIAWDTYFVYPAGVMWIDAETPIAEMPVPAAWYHQLKDREVWEETAERELGSKEWTAALAERSEADPERFRTGDELRTALEAAIRDAASHLHLMRGS